jgi:hypothetical protein
MVRIVAMRIPPFFILIDFSARTTRFAKVGGATSPPPKAAVPEKPTYQPLVG